MPGGMPEHALKSKLYERIATELCRPQQVLESAASGTGRRRARPELDMPTVGPRTGLERELARIWAELLRFESVGVDENFFDLGGSSLLAVNLFARLERQFGKKLPLSSLIDHPTIEQLAPLLVGEAERDSLVLIRKGGDQPPLFLVHDGDGETMLYRSLALHLRTDRAVFGLEPFSRAGIPLAHSRIEEMAAYHIGKMRSVQPRGPYLVGGMCAGGMIAFEIARQLQGMGERVAILALIDAADVEARLKSWRFTSQRLKRWSVGNA